MRAPNERGHRAQRRRLQAVVALSALLVALLAVALPSGAEELDTASTRWDEAADGSPSTTAPTPVDLTGVEEPPTTTTTAPRSTSTSTTIDEGPGDAEGGEVVAPDADAPAPTTSTIAPAQQAVPDPPVWSLAEAAQPAAPSLSATPSTGLVQGDTVTVTGTGFPAGDRIGIVQCKLVTDGPIGCNLSTLVYSTADASGSFSASFVPRRILYVDGTPVDCADLDACKIGAGSVADQTQGADAAIQFDPAVPPPPPPSITVTPDTGLLDGQTVTVTGANYEPDSNFGVIQCVEPPESDGSNCSFDTLTFVGTDASGSFTTSFQVVRTITSLGATTDCADPGACVIGAGPGPSGQGDTAPVQFDPSIPPPPPPTLTVTPDTDLLDRQAVTVTVTGFDTDRSVVVTQCLASVEPGACTGAIPVGPVGPVLPVGPVPTTVVQPAAIGPVTTTFEVRRILRTPAGTADCADPGACVIAAGTYALQLAAPIQFDPTVPPPPPPSLTVTPDTDLLDGDTVRVVGEGFEPDGFVGIGQCPTSTLDPVYGCPYGGGPGTPTDGDGTFEVDVVVDRLLYPLDGSTVDCADPDACVLFARDFLAYGITTSAPLAFDASVPPPPPPAITVTPDTGVADGQLVAVAGTGYPRRRGVAVLLCRADTPGAEGCDLSTQTYVQTDAAGTFDADLVVDRYIEVDTGTIDCGQPDACVVAGGVPPSGPGAVAPIQLDPDAPPPPGPTVTVTPATGLVDGQMVTVEGTGFPRGTTVSVIQCRAGATDLDGCDPTSLHPAPVGPDRSFRTPFAVRRTLQTASGAVDCSVPGACFVGAGALPGGHGVHADTPIVVDGGIETPPTTPTTEPGGAMQRVGLRAVIATEVTPSFTG
jgi:hypothetical protein